MSLLIIICMQEITKTIVLKKYLRARFSFLAIIHDIIIVPTGLLKIQEK